VPVYLKTGNLPSTEQLGGWLSDGGKPLSVNAVEEGPAQLFVVLGVHGEELVTKASKFRNLTSKLLSKGDELLFVSAAALRVASGTERTDLFMVTQPMNGPVDDLFRAMRKSGLPEPAPGSLRFADAVASAGLMAMHENRRRAVLLVLSGEPEDMSVYDPGSVRRFLAALRVPLFVWYLGTPRPGSEAAAWKAEEISQSWHVASSSERIHKDLEAQRIVMVDGRHLPQAVTLAPAATGLELVGATP